MDEASVGLCGDCGNSPSQAPAPRDSPVGVGGRGKLRGVVPPARWNSGRWNTEQGTREWATSGWGLSVMARRRWPYVAIALLAFGQSPCLPADDELPLQSVAMLKAPEFDEPAAAATPGDDNIVYRLVQALVPDGRDGPPPPADIASPGPDTANFPRANSQISMPQPSRIACLAQFRRGTR